MKDTGINQKIGNRMRRLRKSNGLSMAMAYRLRTDYEIKIDPSYLSRIERGRVEIPLRTICAVAKFFEVSPAELVDPCASDAPRGVEYILEDPNIIEDLRLLREKLGEEEAKNYIRRFLLQLLGIIRRVGDNGETINALSSDGEQTQDTQTVQLSG